MFFEHFSWIGIIWLDRPILRMYHLLIKYIGGEAVPTLDVVFPIRGNHIPADHGYLLYSAVCRVVPNIHGNAEIGIHPVHGHLQGNRRLRLTPHSAITFRLPHEHFAAVLPLAGKELVIGSEKVRVGVPQATALQPSTELFSRLVTIKGYMDPDGFLLAVEKQLAALEIDGQVRLLLPGSTAPFEGGVGSSSPVVRRTLRVQGKDVVGFAVEVSELSAEHSIKLQESGLGGRRLMGCGIFVPRVRRAA